MATIKLELFKSKKLKDSRHPIMIRITQNRTNRYLNTGFSAFPEEWNSEAMQFSDNYKKNFKLTQPKFDMLKSSLLEKYTDVLNISLELLKKSKNLDVDLLISKAKKTEKTITFNKFSEQIILENKKSGRLGNAINYKTMLNVVKKFDTSVEISFGTINYEWLKKFEAWNLKKGNKINSINVYLRAVRAVLNRAIKENVIEGSSYPFGHGKYEIPSSPTQKRAINKSAIKAIENLQLPENSTLWHVQNYFLFSFYCRGMNWIDMAKLKMENIVSGRIEYLRTKTIRKNARSFSIKTNPQIQKILDFYGKGKKAKDYIFPIILREDNIELARMDIRNSLKNFNKHLNELSKLAGVEGHLTSYTARHSWGTIAKKLGVDIAVISDGYGHANISTTQIYLDNIENEEIDKANDLITG